VAVVPIKVSTCDDGACTEVLGSSPSTYDSLILRFADRNGIPPQLIKGHANMESGGRFNPSAFRYEALTIDFAKFTKKNFQMLRQNLKHPNALQPWILAETTDCSAAKILAGLSQGIFLDLGSANATPRSKYVLSRDKGGTAICDVRTPSQVTTNSTAMAATDLYPSMANVFFTNDNTNAGGWTAAANRNHLTTPQDFKKYLNEGGGTFTAQTVVGSSYGLLQVLYTTATSQEGYVTPMDGRGLPPGDLFDANVALSLGTEYLARLFYNDNSDGHEDAAYADLDHLMYQYVPALRLYNGGPGTQTPANVEDATIQCDTKVTAIKDITVPYQYACDVLRRTKAYSPLP
jgi:hypothetical protein